MTTDDKKLLREIEHYERIAGQPVPEGAKGVRKNATRSVVYSLRLNPEDIAEVERVAEQLDVPATALVRGFVLDGLAQHRKTASPAAVIEHIESELLQLRGLIRQRTGS